MVDEPSNELLELGEVVVVDRARCGVVFDAEGGGGCGGDGVLCAVAHELGDGSGDVGDADVLAGHHEVVDVAGVEAAEREPG